MNNNREKDKIRRLIQEVKYSGKRHRENGLGEISKKLIQENSLGS